MEQDILQRSDFFETKCVKNVLESMCLGPCKHIHAMQETRVQSLGREDLLEEGMATHSSILAGEFHGQKSLVGYSSWGRKESDMIE